MDNLISVLPEKFKEQMQEVLKEKYADYEKSMGEPAVRGIRINTKKIDEKLFLNLTHLPLEKLGFSDDGFLLLTDEKLGNTPAHLSGLCYLQEPSSMLAVCASGIEKFSGNQIKVLDLCAAPGGKTSQIASRIGESDVIFSNEIVSSRVNALYSNIERQGFKNIVITNEKPENLLAFESYFDFVFVDAPCSGEGMFRKNPETINEWSYENVVMCADRQKQILDVAQRLVKAGGKLIYSTCTFSQEEDEQIVEHFLKNYNFEIVDVPKEIKACTIPAKLDGKKGEYARKFLPFSGKGEGQFVAVFKNKDDENERFDSLFVRKHTKSIFEIGRSEKQILFDWINQNMNPSFARNLNGQKLLKVGDTVYLSPSEIGDKEISALDSLKFQTIGVKLGKFEKNRFEPDHAMFMAFGDEFKIVAKLQENDVAKFMHGEQLESKLFEKGYAVVKYLDFPLGGAKLVCGKLKNLLPKGLRI